VNEIVGIWYYRKSYTMWL